ncbi:luc7-like protein 3 [Argonauta hians]
MAAHAAAALLDELMGRDRNLQPTEKRSELKWDDPEVCKYFLCGFCPHELFVNTRADLGNCEKIHDDVLRKEYARSGRFEKMGYEEEFMRFLQTLISDVERRIRRGHQRLALNSTQGTPSSNAAALKEEKVAMLTERINDLVQQAENLGCEGKVEEAQGVMKLCDLLREERKVLENQTRQNSQTPESEKTMEVCNVCGALLVVGDIQQRIDEHIMGKQHSGYARIRTYVEERKQRKLQSAEEREARLVREKEEREKEREREKEKEREEKRRKEKEREKERERQREREKRRRRSRSRSRRSRSRERKRRSRSHGHRSQRSNSRDKHKIARRHRSRSPSSSRSHSSRQSNHHRRSQSREFKHRSASKEPKYRSRSPDSKNGSPPNHELNKYHHSRSQELKHRSGSQDPNYRSFSHERGQYSNSKDSNQRPGNNCDRKILYLENDKRLLYNAVSNQRMEMMSYDKYEDGEIPSDSRADIDDSNEETGTLSEGDTK